MMDGFRKASHSVIGRIIITVMFGFLIFSFALWGIGDIFRGYGQRTVATVGKTEIDTQAYRQAFQNELQVMARRYGHAITTEQALGAGVDREVLGRLVSEAALDDKAHAMKLGISDESIVKKLLTSSTFVGANGQFDKARFNDALRQAGYTEASFIAEQHKLDVRQQIIQSISGLPVAPSLISDAMTVYANEERAIEYVAFGKDQLEAAATPDEATLKKFYDENQSAFRAPDYRKFVYVSLSPTDLVDPESIAEADAKAKYDTDLATRYTVAETRAVRQLIFQTEEDAKAIADRLKAGTAFDDVVAERKLQKADTDLGVVEKSTIADPAVADAAFALESNAVSDVIKGKFGFILVTVGEIKPATVRSFESALPEIRAALSISKGKEMIRDLHDKIEDQRASAKPLPEIAKDLPLKLVTLDAVDRSGRTPDGTAIDGIPEHDALLNAAFSSDVGVDNEAVATRTGGYVWFDVLGITPAHDRPLDEVKAQVLSAWQDDDTNGKLAAKAAELVVGLSSGKTMQDIAASLGVEVKTLTGLKRNSKNADLSQSAIGQAFSVPEGGAGFAIGHQALERIILRVTKADVAASATGLAETGKMTNEIKNSLSDDYANAYVGEVQKELGVSVNDKVIGMALGTN